MGTWGLFVTPRTMNALSRLTLAAYLLSFALFLGLLSSNSKSIFYIDRRSEQFFCFFFFTASPSFSSDGKKQTQKRRRFALSLHLSFF